MKIYCCKELKNKSIDSLLELLYSYVELKKDVCSLIKKDKANEDFYVDEHLYFYELNIRKIKSQLIIKSKV